MGQFSKALPLLAALALGPLVEAGVIEPTPLTLRFSAADEETASAKLSEQLGFRATVTLKPGERLTHDGEPMPFASAVRTLIEQAGLTCDDSGGGDGREFSLEPGRPLKTMTVGDTVTVIVPRVHLRSTTKVRQAAGAWYEIEMVAVFDPALEFVGVHRNVLLDRVEVDGHVVSPDNLAAGNETSLPGELMAGPVGVKQCELVFTLPTPAKKIDRLSARLRAWQVAEAAVIDLPVDAMAGGKSSEHGDLTATAAVAPMDGTPGLLVTLTGDAVMRYRDPQWAATVRRCVRVSDKEGRSLPLHPAGASYDASAKAIKVALRSSVSRPVEADLATIHIKLPTKVRCVDVPMEITDLGLPGED